MKQWISLFLTLVIFLALTACSPAIDDPASDADSRPETSAVEIAPSIFAENTDEVFEEGTKVTAVAVTAGTVYEQAKTAVADVAEKVAVYDLQAVKDSAKVQPNGKLKVTFPLPAEFSTNVTVYYVSDAGEREALTTTVDGASRTVSAELAHFSIYVLADVGEKTTAESTTTTAATTTTTTSTTEVTTTTTKVTTTTKKPTTTAKSTTKTTTTTKKPTTTTAASYSAFGSHNWISRTIVEDGGLFCRSYEINLVGQDKSLGESSASPYEEMVPPEYRDEEKPDFEFGGRQWYCGSGGGGAVKSVKEEGNTITIIGEDDGTVVLTRTAENTAVVKSCQSELVSLTEGMVFSIAE